MNDKIIFDFTAQDFQDCEDWMRVTKSKNEEFVQSKSKLYSFDFLRGESVSDGKFEWDEKVTKRISTVRISSVSTLHTLGDDEDDENAEIPAIEDLDIRISNVSLNSPYCFVQERR